MKKFKNIIWIIVSFLLNTAWMFYFLFHSWINGEPTIGPINNHPSYYSGFNSSESIFRIFYSLMENITIVVILTLCIMSVISFLIAFLSNKLILKNDIKAWKVLIVLLIQIALFNCIFPLLLPLVETVC